MAKKIETWWEEFVEEMSCEPGMENRMSDGW